MSEPLIHPLPIYPNLLSKADAIALEIKLPANEVLGAIVRLWLYADLNSEHAPGDPDADVVVEDFRLEDAVTVAKVFFSDGEALLDAMARRGWIEFRGSVAIFPRLKRSRAEAAAGPKDSAADIAGWFDEFWSAYKPALGNPGSKSEARMVWAKIKGLNAALAHEITRKALAHSDARWTSFNGYNPHARRWLLRRMWEDEVPAAATTGTASQNAPGAAKTGDHSKPTLAARLAAKARQKPSGAK